MAEAESGVGGVELFEGDACTAEAVAIALSSLTFAVGRRFVIADGVERWKDSEIEPVVAAMAGVEEADLTVAFFARGGGRYQGPAGVGKAGGGGGGPGGGESAG